MRHYYFLQSAFLLQHILWTSAFLSQPSTQHFIARTNKDVIAKSPSSTRLFDGPEVLAEEGSWQAFLDDETTGLIYYFDTETGESLWEPPTETFPDIRLARKQQRLAEELRQNYRKSRQQEAEVGGDSSAAVDVIEETASEQSGNGLPSWIGGLIEVKETETAPESTEVEKVEELAEEKGGWLNNFFGDNSAADAPVEELMEEKVVNEEVEAKPGIFAAFSGLNSKITSQTESEQTTPVKEKPKVEKTKPKIVDTSPKPIQIEIGSHVLPHPAKKRWGGEDALFVKGRSFGVFDGVSGAEKLDGVPLYSKTLANEMKKAIGNNGLSVQDMTKLLTDAANLADEIATGASTAVVASIGDNGFLQALNLGDSLCLVVRDGKIAAKTREISHYWECPYQLSEDSPDRPRDGTKLNVELIPGDLIIMGSDGIFDNVSDDQLLDCISSSSRLKPGQLSKKICEISRKQSLDSNSETPYGKQAQRRGDPAFKTGLGGKVDDVSCVVVACK